MPIVYGGGPALKQPKVKTTATGNPVGTSGVAPPVAPVYNPYGVYGSPYTVGGNPYAGNLYAGIPSTLAGTPYGATIANAKQYLFTPQQMRGIANQQAGAQINAQLGASYASSAAEQAQLQSMMSRSGGLAAALASFGPQYAQAMSGAYNQGANTIAQLGPGIVQGGGSTLQAAQDAAQQATAAKTDGQGQVSSYNVPDITNTLTQTGVNMPGNALAVAGVNAAQMGLYGAKADEGYALNTVDYYRQQAVNALQQRAAERAGIIAQKPQLFQSALEAQRQDNYQTQNRIDSLTGQATDWINTRRGMAITAAGNQSQWLLGQAALTHINPITGQPMGGYSWADKAHTIVAPFNQIAQASHWADLGRYYNRRTSIQQQALDQKQYASTQPGKFNAQLSAFLHQAVDSTGKPLVDAKGNPIPYKAPAKAPKTLSIADRAKLVGPMAQYVDSLANGVKATTKSAAVDPVSVETAVENLKARGWFSTQFQAQAAAQALQSSYKVTPAEISMMLSGYNPYGGASDTSTTAAGVTTTAPGTGYGPPTPAAKPPFVLPANDPRGTTGKAWNPRLDPLKSFIGTSIMVTQSGRHVDATTQKYL